MPRRVDRLDAWTLLVALMIGSPGAAVADALMGPPSRCPPGSAPIVGHGGSYCVPRSCDESECPTAGVCRDVGLCVATLHVEGASSYERFDEDIEIAIGPCDDARDCEGSARDAYMATHTRVTREGEPRCERVRGCVAGSRETSAHPPAPSDPAPLPPGASPRPTGGCGGCSAQWIASSTFSALAMLGLVGCLRRRRRRSAPRIERRGGQRARSSSEVER